MSPDHDLRRPRGSRRLLRAVALVGALTTSAVAVPAVAAADGGTTVVGEFVQAYAEGAPGGAHDDGQDAVLSWVATGDGAVRVPTGQMADVPAGATVEVTVGGALEDEHSQDGGGQARDVLESDLLSPPPATDTTPVPAPRGGLTNEVTVVLVAPAGTTPDGTRPADVVDAVDGTVADFWAEQTGGAIQLGVVASRPWVTTAAGCADPNALWTEVAATVGFVPGPRKHLLLRLSDQTADQPGCSYALAQVGTEPASGGYLYVREDLPSVIAHELGHNFGLGHSSAEQCDAAVEGGSCRTSGYRDLYDVMGASWAQLGSLNAAQAAALGALPADAQHTLVPGGPATTVTLAPLGGRAGVRAVRLAGAERADYWLEYRAGTGQDGWLGGRENVYGLQQGVLLHRAGSFPDTSLLLDATPGPASLWDADLQAALPVGAPVGLAGGYTVTVEAVTGASAVVRVVPAPPAPAGISAQSAERAAPGGAVASAPVAEREDIGAVETSVASTTWQPARAADLDRSASRRPVVLVSAAEGTSRPGGLVLLAAMALVASGFAVVTALVRARRRRLVPPGSRSRGFLPMR